MGIRSLGQFSPRISAAGAATAAAVAMVLSIGSPALACIGEAGVPLDPAMYPSAVIVFDGMVATDNTGGAWQVSVSELYRGSLLSEVTLSDSGICNYPREKLVPGQRLFAAAFAEPTAGSGDDLETFGTLIWLLDANGRVTDEFERTSPDAPIRFETLSELLSAFQIPDTAMPAPIRPTDATSSLLFVALGGVVVLVAWSLVGFVYRRR